MFSSFRRLFTLTPPGLKSLASSSPAEGGVERYSRLHAGFHWAMAGGVMSLMGTAYVAGTIPNDPEKSSPEKLKFRGQLMELHESVGLIMLGLIVPRLVSRVVTKVPPHLPVAGWQQAAGSATHAALYGALIWMPISGFAFGYTSGWGVPFFQGFDKPFPGTYASKEEIEKNKDWYKKIESFTYDNHHTIGNLLYYIVPLHVGGALFNAARGMNVFARMSIFARRPK